MWATVMEVDTFLDAEGSKAGTSFHIAHFRNEKENNAQGTSVARHPLWKTPWLGSELIPSLNGM
jgi:hypothetical protein